MITKEEIENIAMLAKLSVNEEDYPALISDLQQMVDFADVVRSAEVQSVESESHNAAEICFAEDTVRPSCRREELLANAPVSDGEFFVVRKRA